MSYTVLARRYRSASFDQVVGQEPIARTLQNAIATGRIAHAYLFTGTRGVGKTSMARIFARALNCPDTIAGCPKPPEKHDYPPLDVQERMAQAIMRGDDLNVIEIDGASNNSVDNARQLIANAAMAPAGQARFKIYIIDEVHMLSTAAFNALLKTMEEPPAHVKFILCTTEIHKVPVTIQSRCQRFDFRNIPAARIARHLKDVLQGEKVKTDDALVHQIARLGNGSMRDALSLLDRLIAAAGPEARLTGELIEQVLGLPPQERVVHLVEALATGNPADALQQTAALLDGGIAQDQFLDVLIDRLRTLMLVRACGAESDLIELPEDARAATSQQAQAFDAAGLVYMIALCENCQRSGKSSANPRALLDATIVRLALAEKMLDVTALLQSPAGSAPAPGSVSAPSSRPQPAAALPASPSPDLKKKVTEPPEVSPREVANDGPSTGAGIPPLPSGEGGVRVVLIPQEISGGDSHSSSPPSPVSSRPAQTPTDPAAVWQALLRAIASNVPLTSWVSQLTLRRLEQGVAVVGALPGKREAGRFASQPQRRDQLTQLLREVLGQPVKVEIDTEPSSASGATPMVAPGPLGSPAGDRQAATRLPLVKQVSDVFDVMVVDMRPEESAAPGPVTEPDSPPADTRPPATSLPLDAPDEFTLEDDNDA